MVRFHLTLLAIGELALSLVAPGAQNPPKVVEAQRFVLRDARGQVRAELGLRDGEPSLRVFDAKGQPRGGLELPADGSVRLSLFDPKGTPRAVLSVGKDGVSRLELSDKNTSQIKKNGTGEPPKDKTAPVVVPVSPEGKKRLDAAGVAYRKLCQTCHAADGKGVKTKARREIPDFTDPPWQDSRSDSQLLASILNGRGEDMPPFNDRLNNEQARDLVAYIRTLGARHTTRVRPASSDFEKRLHELQQQWEELEKQLRELHKQATKGR